MKIYVLPTNEKFKPKDQIWRYPKHNKAFGVEQDFLEFLNNHSELITNNPKDADWHYLPIFWTRWHVGHNFAENREGLDELQKEANNIILDDKKTFTICQYDDGPVIDVGNTTLFLSSRKTENGYDIPLLSSDYNPFFIFKPKKKYLASFLGKISTHQIRANMADQLKNREDIFLFDGHKNARFAKKMLQSYIALAPRGYGGSSFRFFEAMHFGVVPFLIGDIDTRPFTEYLPYDTFSFYTNNPSDIVSILESKGSEVLLEMGRAGKKIYEENLIYQKWCNFVIKILHDKR